VSPRSVQVRVADILTAIDAAAERLGNTRAVARSSYVDPRVPKAHRFGRLAAAWDGATEEDGLRAEEVAVRRILALDLPPSSALDDAG
jgi:DNA topoisomerase I